MNIEAIEQRANPFTQRRAVRPVTEALRATRAAEREEAQERLALVYDELRALVQREQECAGPGRRLETAELAQEAWLRVYDLERNDWEDPAAFFGAAARAMRKVLVDRAQGKSTRPGGGGSLLFVCLRRTTDELLLLDEGLQKLETIDARKGEVVLLRFFTGLSLEVVAKVLRIPLATAEREWSFAQAWLRRRIELSRSRAA